MVVGAAVLMSGVVVGATVLMMMSRIIVGAAVMLLEDMLAEDMLAVLLYSECEDDGCGGVRCWCLGGWTGSWDFADE